MKPPRRKGITLVETLVVFVIIGVLAAILFPALSRTRCSNSRMTCQRQMRQIALACTQYRQDSDRRFPLAVDARGNDSKSKSWAGRLRPYLKTAAVFLCPTSKGAKPGQTSYGYNAWLGNCRENQIHNSKFVILNYEVIPDLYGWTQTGTGPSQVTANRHLDGANYSFVDGHAKWYPTGTVKALPSTKNQPIFNIR